jgi:pyruvate formate lyase activating enzyme
MPHEAILFDTLPGSRVQCNVCQWRCVINPGRVGVCRVRRNEEGRLYSLNYALVSSAAVDPIEKKPLYHFYPGTQVFSLGGWGCNFHCAHCQNWEIACVETPSGSDRDLRVLSPEETVCAAVEHSCGELPGRTMSRCLVRVHA